jgi:muramoyltetrapeptide carboxypeptidase
MNNSLKDAVLPGKLMSGDRVRFVSPASTPTRESVEDTAKRLTAMGLKVEIGEHVFDRLGYLAGKDEDRLADINDALRDPGVKAVIATMGGKGAYRIADGMDFAAARKYPKLLVGFSEITILHLALYKNCGYAGIHGAPWGKSFGKATADSFYKTCFTTDPSTIRTNPEESTATLTTHGKVSGILLGGNQDLMATAAGWMLPSFKGAILLIEAVGLRLGHIDRQLTMLKNAGHLDGIVGIAVGQYTNCTSDATTQGDWTAMDVLRDRLPRLGVPILGGLPIGHGDNPIAVPLGVMATLDADAGVLTVAAGVC